MPKGIHKNKRETIWSNPQKVKMYYVLRDMKSRCYNPSNKRYNRYGGRGIKICNRWAESLDAFIEDMGYAPKDLQIDRIDNDKGYFKENCKWSTRKEQNDNRGGKFKLIKNKILDLSINF